MGTLWRYALTPGVEAEAPGRWPGASRIPRTPGRPTLVMFAHPRCGCTRASVGELALLMAQARGRLSAHVVFFQPTEAGVEWSASDLWKSALAIPGVQVLRDDGGVEARRFRAATSGQTLLYDARGRLVFRGGITAARGHSGDNAGRSAVLALLNSAGRPASRTPVFGCSILGALAPQR